MWRHGDVLIEAIAELPSGAKRRPGAILARGEITGHSHRFQDATSAEIWQCGDEMYFVVAETATVVHEEHEAITLPRGVYRFWQQREYTPQAIRRIVD
jgi:hypothetical protein